MPHATFVIATYRRADALRATLRSLCAQTRGDWTALVVGDACGDETADAVRSLKDARIRYYNLPKRFGEQSGPNTAGLHLAQGDFVAFLNHDDLLLQDHLAHMVERMDGADLCFGRFAVAHRVEAGAPVFTETGPRATGLSDLFGSSPWAFDPSSFWLVRTAFAKAVGPWRRAAEVRRTPLRDWLLRAWRLRGRFRFGTKLTGLRFLTHAKRTGPPLYDAKAVEHAATADRLGKETAGETRAFIEAQTRGGPGAAVPWWRAPARLRRKFWAAVWMRLGVDREAILGPLRGRRRGALLEDLSRKRTGAPLPAAPTLDRFLEDPEAYRVV